MIALMLLFKMNCMFFFTIKTGLCTFSDFCHARFMQCQIYAALWARGRLCQLEEYLILLSVQL